MEESPIDAVVIIRIPQFNQKTSQDVGDILNNYGTQNIKHLILDLRNNKGGPPLAAREIMGYFLPPEDILFFIARKNRQPFLLATSLNEEFYDGPISVLVTKNTASAAETMSAVLQRKERATIIGQETANAHYLKSVYDYEDGSTLMLMTSKTFYHDRHVFPNSGIMPDIKLSQGIDIIEFTLNRIRENKF